MFANLILLFRLYVFRVINIFRSRSVTQLSAPCGVVSLVILQRPGVELWFDGSVKAEFQVQANGSFSFHGSHSDWNRTRKRWVINHSIMLGFTVNSPSQQTLHHKTRHHLKWNRHRWRLTKTLCGKVTSNESWWRSSSILRKGKGVLSEYWNVRRNKRCWYHVLIMIS